MVAGRSAGARTARWEARLDDSGPFGDAHRPSDLFGGRWLGFIHRADFLDLPRTRDRQSKEPGSRGIYAVEIHRIRSLTGHEVGDWGGVG